MASRKKTNKRIVRRKTTRKGIPIRKPAIDYIETKNGVLIPNQLAVPVESSKLKIGFNKAKKEIDIILQEIVNSMKEEYTIKEIELVASFNADGKFLGFGVGGSASIKIKIAPGK